MYNPPVDIFAGDCNLNAVLLAGPAFFVAFGISSTSFLFLFRVRAVFWGDIYTLGFFILAWLVVLGTCFAVPFGVKTEHLGPHSDEGILFGLCRLTNGV